MLAEMKPKKAVVIRSGALGACYALSSAPDDVCWVPAYWTSDRADRVVDVTGAGNGFLGGFCAGLDEGMDVRQGESTTEEELIVAVIRGTIAASFIVEQVGLPVMTTSELGTEIWNDDLVRDRIERLERTVGDQ